MLQAGIPPAAITLSSDAGGSLPRFDTEGQFTGSTVGRPESLLSELRDMIALRPDDPDWARDAISTVTANVASRLKLPGKGHLQSGGPADLVVLNEDFTVRLLLAKGKIMNPDGRTDCGADTVLIQE
jgi:beta-aspartyl-dipeptidase (metallo-type)